MIKKGLSIHVSTLEKMIEGNYIYIDKTEYIYNLFQGISHYYFLSRPRRFGKSLLISTLKELFLGNRKLFENLWIGSSDYDWQQYPVIHLDFSVIDHRTSEELQIAIVRKLEKIAHEHTIDISQDPTLGSILETLVVELSKKNKVVILVDEYDKPILDHIKNTVEADKQRDVLKNFYDVIKGLDAHLRAFFVTGVSRFSKTSLFSGMNNLDDLTLDPKAAQLLGYTQKEIEEYFFQYLQDLAKDKEKTVSELMADLKKWYNGYRFSDKNVYVYNPFSLLYSLNKKKFENYWYQSGTPTFLIHLIKNQYTGIEKIDQKEFGSDGLGNFEINNIPLIPLLFQTGYLTIASYNEITGKFKLNFPNYEVELSFTKFLIAALSGSSSSVIDTLGSQLIYALNTNNIEKFCSILQTLLAHIPYNLIQREDYYHTLFQFLLSLLSLEAQSEIMTNKGRIDLVVCTTTHIFIFELKINVKPEMALAQIKERGYYERFLHKGKLVVLVGLSFVSEKDQVSLRYIQEVI